MSKNTKSTNSLLEHVFAKNSFTNQGKLDAHYLATITSKNSALKDMFGQGGIRELHMDQFAREHNTVNSQKAPQAHPDWYENNLNRTNSFCLKHSPFSTLYSSARSDNTVYPKAVHFGSGLDEYHKLLSTALTRLHHLEKHNMIRIHPLLEPISLGAFGKHEHRLLGRVGGNCISGTMTGGMRTCEWEPKGDVAKRDLELINKGFVRKL